jgi:hypothetical protein
MSSLTPLALKPPENSKKEEDTPTPTAAPVAMPNLKTLIPSTNQKGPNKGAKPKQTKVTKPATSKPVAKQESLQFFTLPKTPLPQLSNPQSPKPKESVHKFPLRDPVQSISWEDTVKSAYCIVCLKESPFWEETDGEILAGSALKDIVYSPDGISAHGACGCCDNSVKLKTKGGSIWVYGKSQEELNATFAEGSCHACGRNGRLNGRVIKDASMPFEEKISGDYKDLTGSVHVLCALFSHHYRLLAINGGVFIFEYIKNDNQTEEYCVKCSSIQSSQQEQILPNNKHQTVMRCQGKDGGCQLKMHPYCSKLTLIENLKKAMIRKALQVSTPSSPLSVVRNESTTQLKLSSAKNEMTSTTSRIEPESNSTSPSLSKGGPTSDELSMWYFSPHSIQTAWDYSYLEQKLSTLDLTTQPFLAKLETILSSIGLTLKDFKDQMVELHNSELLGEKPAESAPSPWIFQMSTEEVEKTKTPPNSLCNDHRSEVSYYCYCGELREKGQLDELTSSVCCDECGCWYHNDCAETASGSPVPEEGAWICRKCKELDEMMKNFSAFNRSINGDPKRSYLCKPNGLLRDLIIVIRSLFANHHLLSLEELGKWQLYIPICLSSLFEYKFLTRRAVYLADEVLSRTAISLIKNELQQTVDRFRENKLSEVCKTLSKVKSKLVELTENDTNLNKIVELSLFPHFTILQQQAEMLASFELKYGKGLLTFAELEQNVVKISKIRIVKGTKFEKVLSSLMTSINAAMSFTMKHMSVMQAVISSESKLTAPGVVDKLMNLTLPKIASTAEGILIKEHLRIIQTICPNSSEKIDQAVLRLFFKGEEAKDEFMQAINIHHLLQKEENLRKVIVDKLDKKEIVSLAECEKAIEKYPKYGKFAQDIFNRIKKRAEAENEHTLEGENKTAWIERVFVERGLPLKKAHYDQLMSWKLQKKAEDFLGGILLLNLNQLEEITKTTAQYAKNSDVGESMTQIHQRLIDIHKVLTLAADEEYPRKIPENSRVEEVYNHEKILGEIKVIGGAREKVKLSAKPLVLLAKIVEICICPQEITGRDLKVLIDSHIVPPTSPNLLQPGPYATPALNLLLNHTPVQHSLDPSTPPAVNPNFISPLIALLSPYPYYSNPHLPLYPGLESLMKSLYGFVYAQMESTLVQEKKPKITTMLSLFKAEIELGGAYTTGMNLKILKERFIMLVKEVVALSRLPSYSTLAQSGGPVPIAIGLGNPVFNEVNVGVLRWEDWKNRVKEVYKLRKTWSGIPTDKHSQLKDLFNFLDQIKTISKTLELVQSFKREFVTERNLPFYLIALELLNETTMSNLPLNLAELKSPEIQDYTSYFEGINSIRRRYEEINSKYSQLATILEKSRAAGKKSSFQRLLESVIVLADVNLGDDLIQETGFYPVLEHIRRNIERSVMFTLDFAEELRKAISTDKISRLGSLLDESNSEQLKILINDITVDKIPKLVFTSPELNSMLGFIYAIHKLHRLCMEGAEGKPISLADMELEVQKILSWKGIDEGAEEMLRKQGVLAELDDRFNTASVIKELIIKGDVRDKNFEDWYTMITPWIRTEENRLKGLTGTRLGQGGEGVGMIAIWQGASVIASAEQWSKYLDLVGKLNKMMTGQTMLNDIELHRLEIHFYKANLIPKDAHSTLKNHFPSNPFFHTWAERLIYF